MRFRDRADAGRRLGAALAERHLVDPLVLGLPRGGVPVAAEVARILGAPLDVVVARKLGAPGRPELAIGAVAEGGAQVIDRTLVERLGVTRAELDATLGAERAELARRVALYRGDRPLPALSGRSVVVVDDGLATGATAVAALRAVRAGGAQRLILAVPVGAPTSVERAGEEADDVVCLRTPSRFRAVGQWYSEFDQVDSDEVLALIDRDQTGPEGAGPG